EGQPSDRRAPLLDFPGSPLRIFHQFHTAKLLRRTQPTQAGAQLLDFMFVWLGLLPSAKVNCRYLGRKYPAQLPGESLHTGPMQADAISSMQSFSTGCLPQ